jgi:5-methyltetrahydrofolate--homocysteine methyltransferase
MLDIIQDETDVPICLDSPSPRSLVQALPFCKKPGIVNSVSMEGSKIDTIFPIIADTTWGCIALLCDDKGIPNSVERRMEAFEGVMGKAKEYGIDPSRLYIDPLVITLSTDDRAFTLFAECCRLVKEQYPSIHVTSGLSNISFGLPARKLINQAFMTLAMQAGMDSAIVDPTNRDMLGLIYAADCLLEKDESCLEFIGAFRDGIIGPLPKKD